ncbi:MAG: hypothetical protein MUF23_16505 [Pirellula sp.]|jgi:hypothetical protein|nr:hypothetical protein [Pirellula sp.]
MNSALDRWSSASAFFSDSIVQAVLGLVVLSVLSAIAYFALAKLRDSNRDDQQLDDVLRKNFEEMRSEGDIDDQEFRKIKALLAGGERSSGPASLKTTPRTGPSQEIDADSSNNL